MYECDFNTHKIGFYTQSKSVSFHESNFYTYEYDTHKCDNNMLECNFHTHCDFYTHKIGFYTQSVILHAECGFHTHESMTHEYDTNDCDFNRTKTDFYTQSVLLTRMSLNMTLTSVTYTRTS
jgi:hypothetical protein